MGLEKDHLTLRGKSSEGNRKELEQREWRFDQNTLYACVKLSNNENLFVKDVIVREAAGHRG